MASAQVVETSPPNHSASLDSNHPDDLFQSRYRYVSAGVKASINFNIVLTIANLYLSVLFIAFCYSMFLLILFLFCFLCWWFYSIFWKKYGMAFHAAKRRELKNRKNRP